jgi:peptide/nickel transport system permease protein
MLTYLIRRILLFIPTLIGATMLVFFVVALGPGGITAIALTNEGTMRPEAKKAREEYMNERFGLKKPLIVQYGRWLNSVSPLGFETWSREAKEVVAAAAEEAKLEAPTQTRLNDIRARMLKLVPGAQDDQISAAKAEIALLDAELTRIDVSPDAGEVRFSRPTIKAPSLGTSLSRGRSVGDLISEALPITIILQAISIPISYFIAILTGVYAAKHRGKSIDVVFGTVAIALWSLPIIWVAVLLIGFLANDNNLHIFPTFGLTDLESASFRFLPAYGANGFERGYLFDTLWHLILPILCMSYANVAFLQKLTRGSLLENIHSDFVRTARAKGQSESVTLWAHAFRNSLIPLITVTAFLLPSMVSGSVIVETVFGINGMGKLTVDAIMQRDRELFLSNTLVIVALTMVGTLVSDVLNVIADPRVSYE